MDAARQGPAGKQAAYFSSPGSQNRKEVMRAFHPGADEGKEKEAKRAGGKGFVSSFTGGIGALGSLLILFLSLPHSRL